MLVVFTHGTALTGEGDYLKNFTHGYYTFGSISLMLFFGISGYLVTDSLLKSRSVKDYLIKRALRILPALVTVVFLTVFILGPILTELTLLNYFSQNQTWIYLLNATAFTARFTLPGVLNGETINANLWTLPMETRLYLLVALMGVLSLARNKIFHWILLLLLLAYGIFWALNIPVSFRYISLDLAAFFLATSLYRMFNWNIQLRWWWYVLLMLLLIIAWNTSLYPAFEVLILPFFLIEFGKAKRIIKMYLGGIDLSYGIYLISFPVQMVLLKYGKMDEPWQLFFVTMLIVLPMSYCSWTFVEKKFLAMKPKWISP